MKKTLRYLIVAVLTLCMVQAAALADAPITVQLDGKNVTFTDAQPQIVNDRTFLPVRAVFEAMGATVDFKDGVVTAVRGDKTVSMTVGSTEASVTENGKTEKLTMDVAPFIDAKLSRTYVPVRFAAQALGANVGWDGAQRTVVIVDAEKQLAAALEGKSFTYLEKLAKYTDKYNEGVWTSEVTLKGSLETDTATLTGGESAKASVPMTATAKGVMKDGAKVDLNEKITMDLSAALKQMAAQTAEADKAELAEMEAMAKALAANGITVTVRGDLNTGKLYVNADISALGSELTEAFGVNKDTWFVIDANAMGIDIADLMAQSKNMDYKKMLESSLASAEVNDSAKSYSEFSAMLKALTEKLSDAGFTKNGDVYSTTIDQTVQGMALKLTISMTMKNDAVVAYSMDMDFGSDMAELGAMKVVVKMSIDEQDKVSGKMTMQVGSLLNANFDITGSYVKGGAEPQTQPPEGAAIIDLMQMLGGLTGLGE